MDTQKLKVLNHLRTHKNGITSWEAITNYHVTRLAAYIGFLRDDGHTIEAVREQHDNKSYARYFLISEAKQ
jgi:hypothetical protein